MYIGIDLGTTNIKAAAYDEGLKLIGRASMPVEYVREKGFIELDAEKYFDKLLSLLRGLIRGRDIREIALTGQAETLICLDTEGRPLMNAISWMDERSAKFCSRLQSLFSQDEIEAVTGQLSVLPTWPATKILWLKSERPDIFQKTDKFNWVGMMLLDPKYNTTFETNGINEKSTQKDVEKLLGKPTESYEKAGLDDWRYNYYINGKDDKDGSLEIGGEDSGEVSTIILRRPESE